MNFEQLARDSLPEGVFDTLPQVAKDVLIADQQKTYKIKQEIEAIKQEVHELEIDRVRRKLKHGVFDKLPKSAQDEIVEETKKSAKSCCRKCSQRIWSLNVKRVLDECGDETITWRPFTDFPHPWSENANLYYDPLW